MQDCTQYREGSGEYLVCEYKNENFRDTLAVGGLSLLVVLLVVWVITKRIDK